MASNVINKNQTILNNNISDQVLSHANQLTTKSWNDIINSLRTQANVNARYISTLHQWLIGTGEGTFIVPDEKSFVEFVLECLTRQVNVEIIQADQIDTDSIYTKSGDNVFNIANNIMQFGSEDATVKLSGAGRPLIQDTDNTYKKIATVDDLQNIPTLEFEIVDNLPNQNISTNVIYLKPDISSPSQNIYEEYVYVNDKWELIGSKHNESINLVDLELMLPLE